MLFDTGRRLIRISLWFVSYYIVPNQREFDEIQTKVTEIFFMADRKFNKKT